MRGNSYQIVLIALGAIVSILFGAFLYREIYPEYAIYQNTYQELENFRSTYTNQSPPPFKAGIKQIVIPNKDKGPEQIDRCISCHVALEFEHFSPTKIAYDINGNMQYDSNGFPLKIPNEEYVWKKLDNKIESLKDEKTNEQLIAEGKQKEVNERLALAKHYESLKVANVGDKHYDMTKVLGMHPLIGRETRPFEFHPVEEYSCTSCHNGNGRGLTTAKAHGPIFDGQYETEFMGPVPKFLESDPVNDPLFSKVFNHKPGHSLLFQTTPLFVGSLIEAKCVQCHRTSEDTLTSAYETANALAGQKSKQYDTLELAYNTEVEALYTLLMLEKSIKNNGLEETYDRLENEKKSYLLTTKQIEQLNSQLSFLRKYLKNSENIEKKIEDKASQMVGYENLKYLTSSNEPLTIATIKKFVEEKKENPSSKGSLFDKAIALDLELALIQHVKSTELTFRQAVNNKSVSSMISDVDLLTSNYKRGKELFLSQACYACHRIAGFSRGGVGLELTEEGKKYPWFVKESIVWPQADLKTSTMPNFRLDHEELEALMTFLLGQTGKSAGQSDLQYKVAVQEWETGKKMMPFEKPLLPSQIQDLDYAAEIYTVEGCAACHRLKGFTSNVGFAKEKTTQNFEEIYEEKEWFKRLFPEEIEGSSIILAIEKNKDEIDKRIVDNVRKNSILEKIQENHPKSLESLYSNFKFALRAKNDKPEETVEWKKRVHRILMMYIQEYGLGRLVGPRPNWSGIYRSDEWLMEHFKNPSAHVARSIMPVFPFSNNKFYALTFLLDTLAKKNRDDVRAIWENRGFNPKTAYDVHCSQCHGDYLQGNGPVSKWIYPIPKSLRNADFLRNLTKEKVYDSIMHGVKGTPMPPWGEIGEGKSDMAPVLTQNEIHQLVDWIFSSLPGGAVIRSSEDVPKWQYEPEDVIKEMKNEGHILESKKTDIKNKLSFLPNGFPYIASLNEILPLQEKATKSDVDLFFDVKESPSADRPYYYIKKEFYTPENLEEGEVIYIRDCSVCHGREADGAGNRAGAMVHAKPRMLTNLDWLDSRDDLRLLRSIKYGVAGTAMVAWGDQTSSKQRMQLVMYIRSLSEESNLRSALFKDVYNTYNESELLIEQIRSSHYDALKGINKELQQVQLQRNELDYAVRQGKADANKVVQLYTKELSLINEQNDLQKKDDLLQSLLAEIKNERALMVDLGLILISQRNEDLDPTIFNKIISLEKNRFTIKDNALVFNDVQNKQVTAIQDQLIHEIDLIKKNLAKQKEVKYGQISSPEVKMAIQEIERKSKAFDDLKRTIISTLHQAEQLKEKQKKLLREYQETRNEKEKDSKDEQTKANSMAFLNL